MHDRPRVRATARTTDRARDRAHAAQVRPPVFETLTAHAIFYWLCWGAPLRYKQFTGSASRLSLASTFSGGVFLALAFGHMIPEAAAAFATSPGT